MQESPATLQTKHLSLVTEFKNLSAEGEFEGYASTSGNVDRGGDLIERGAFAGTLSRWSERGRLPKMLWQHDTTKVCGVWDAMSEDSSGLYVKGRILTDLQIGKEAYTLMKAGAIDSLSIGYRTMKYGYAGPQDEVRLLKEVDLFEVSLVTFPMNESAVITGVKHLSSKGDVERALRDAGVPNAFAKLVALYGFDEAKRRVEGRREADAAGIFRELSKLRDNLNKRKGVAQP